MNSKPNYYINRVLRRGECCDKRAMRFKLLQYRTHKKLTQVQVAEFLGISQGLYNQLESGKRRMNETYLEALGDLYGVSPTQLIVDTVRDDPLFEELDSLYRLLSPSERKMLVSSAKGLAAENP